MKNILLIASIFLSSALCYGQSEGSAIAYGNWDFGFPVGNNFVSSFSGWGGNIGIAYFPKKDFAVGFELGWNSYYQYAPTKTYYMPDGAATTDLYKYIYTLPLTATFAHWFEMGHTVTPYIKVGLGAQFSDQDLYYNIYETTNSNWGFVVIPELGVNLRFSPYSHWSMNMSVRYKYSTNSASQYNLNDIQTVNFNIGLVARIK
jgi:hypothetical protein